MLGRVFALKTARDLPRDNRLLKQQQNLHRTAIAKIQKYLDGVAKAKVNKAGGIGGRFPAELNPRHRLPLLAGRLIFKLRPHSPPRNSTGVGQSM
jgi:hypothetical protein